MMNEHWTAIVFIAGWCACVIYQVVEAVTREVIAAIRRDAEKRDAPSEPQPPRNVGWHGVPTAGINYMGDDDKWHYQAPSPPPADERGGDE